jgi:hypothetical protein
MKKKLQEYGRPQMCPYSPKPKQFGTEAKASLPPEASAKLDTKGIKNKSLELYFTMHGPLT